MQEITKREEQALLEDIAIFAGLEGAKNVTKKNGVIHYTKQILFGAPTRCTIHIKQRVNKRRGSISYTVTTKFTDWQGTEGSRKGATEYSFSTLYHTISAHCRSIIA